MDTEKQPKKHSFLKVFLKSIAVIILILMMIFLSLFVYYAWQFKYGSAADIQRITESVNKSRFNLAQTSKENINTVEQDISKFIRDHNPRIGNSAADITVLAFIDFECPFCQASYQTFKKVMDKYGSVVNIVFKHLPLVDIHPNSIAAANAASCAQAQGKFWEYYNILFVEKRLDQNSLIEFAESLDLDSKKFRSCLSLQTYQLDIQQDIVDAVELKVQGTPTYFVNQNIIEGVVDISEWDKIIMENFKK